MILSPTTATEGSSRLSRAIPDLLALVYSLALAWFLKWEVKDLVWGLWLSSLTVGYATIVLTIFGPMVRSGREDTKPLSAVAMVVGGVFMLLFFTVHFGMFHFVHSAFLNLFFPVLGAGHKELPGATIYWEVLKSYWPFVLGAAVSERMNLATAVKKTNPMVPYKNVIRMHLLIFFFAGAAAAKLNSFLIYAVVLCVYFFPFKACFGEQQPDSPAAEL
jgi:hypothetical protein